MMLPEKKQRKFELLLNEMAEALQLDDSRYDRMKSTYEALKKWLEADELFFKPFKYEVYPHGSVRTGTTVKPIATDEFDLDVALHLKSESAHYTPQNIYQELKRRLEENQGYKQKMELKNRCIRLNYSGDFHMDILPGIQENIYDEDKLMVPDREQKTWVSSNPRGYAKWFKAKANMLSESLLEKSIRAEKLPPDTFKHKKPLQRAVQLIKRYRDVYFEKDDTYKTSSIVLTTIAGHLYRGEDSIFYTIDGIVERLTQQLNSFPARFKVLNPMNHEEDFTDKWEREPEYYSKFKDFIDHFRAEWQKLKIENDVNDESNIFKSLFGESSYNTAASKLGALENQPTALADPYEGLKKLATPITPTHKPWTC